MRFGHICERGALPLCRRRCPLTTVFGVMSFCNVRMNRYKSVENVEKERRMEGEEEEEKEGKKRAEKIVRKSDISLSVGRRRSINNF